jgi:glycosyltransferase involved in cell wall biosynthesis
MKIWILQTGEFLQIDGENVRPMRAINLSEYFLKRGHTVNLLSSDFSHQMKSHRYKNLTEKDLSHNFQITLIPSPGYKSNISFRRLLDHFILGINTFKYLFKIRPEQYPDFVFVGYPPIETTFFISIWLKLKKIPFCVDVKDQWPHIFLQKSIGLKRKFLKLILTPYFFAAKFSLNKANFLTAITPNFLNWSENFSNNFNKNNRALYLVPNIKEISQLKLEESLIWWEKQIGIDIKKKNKIIFAGNINNAYDFNDLISTLLSPRLDDKNFEILICGDGDCLNYLKSKLNKKRNVFFTGWIDYSQLIALKKLSIATLAPYRSTSDFQMSIPNKIIDSLYFGLPIITSLKGEVENIIKKYNVGYFCDRNFTWHDQISSCLNDPIKRDLLSNNARKLYKDKFTSDIVYGEFVQFIEENY